MQYALGLRAFGANARRLISYQVRRDPCANGGRSDQQIGDGLEGRERAESQARSRQSRRRDRGRNRNLLTAGAEIATDRQLDAARSIGRRFEELAGAAAREFAEMKSTLAQVGVAA